MKDFTRELNLWADRIEKSNYNTLQKAEALKPPEGFTPIPGSKKGGFHKRVGDKYQTWYPQHGITHGNIKRDMELKGDEFESGHNFSPKEGQAKVTLRRSSTLNDDYAHSGSITTYDKTEVERGPVVQSRDYTYMADNVVSTLNTDGSKNKLELFSRKSKVGNKALNKLKREMMLLPGAHVKYNGEEYTTVANTKRGFTPIVQIKSDKDGSIKELEWIDAMESLEPVNFDEVVSAVDKEAGTKRSMESSYGEAMDALHDHLYSEKTPKIDTSVIPQAVKEGLQRRVDAGKTVRDGDWYADSVRKNGENARRMLDGDLHVWLREGALNTDPTHSYSRYLAKEAPELVKELANKKEALSDKPNMAAEKASAHHANKRAERLSKRSM